jgi:hypothetical protein
MVIFFENFWHHSLPQLIYSQEQELNFHFLADFFDEFKIHNIAHSFDGMDRLFRGHGHTLQDIYVLRVGMFPRIPDLVVWPGI